MKDGGDPVRVVAGLIGRNEEVEEQEPYEKGEIGVRCAMQEIKVTFSSLAEDERKHLTIPRSAEHTWTHSEGADSSSWWANVCRLHELTEDKKKIFLKHDV